MSCDFNFDDLGWFYSLLMKWVDKHILWYVNVHVLVWLWFFDDLVMRNTWISPCTLAAESKCVCFSWYMMKIFDDLSILGC